MSALKRLAIILACFAAAAADGNPARAAIHLRNYIAGVSAGAGAAGSGVNHLPDIENVGEFTHLIGSDAQAATGVTLDYFVDAVAQSGPMLAISTARAHIVSFDPSADQFTIVMFGTVGGSTTQSSSLGVSGGQGHAQTSIDFHIDKPYHVTFAATTIPGGSALARAGFGGNGGTPWSFAVAPGQSTIITPLRPDLAAASWFSVGGTASSDTNAISDFILFLSFSAVDVGPVGSSQAAPVPPTIMSDGEYTFTGAVSGLWVDPPLTDGYRYTMTGDSLFTSILDFPTGFDDTFEVYVGGSLLGNFGPGDRFDFPGGGVSEFLVRGINPLVDVENPAGFPLRLAYDTPTADFVMTADPSPTSSGVIPEQTTFITWGALLMLVGGHLGWRRSSGGR